MSLKIKNEDFKSLFDAIKTHYRQIETIEQIKQWRKAKKSAEFINWSILWDSKYNFRHLNEYLNDDNISSALRVIFQELGEVDEICPSCGAYNCYAWQDCNPNDDDILNDKKDLIYHIPTASCFDWQCGKCKLSFADKNSPIMAEVYTHINYLKDSNE